MITKQFPLLLALSVFATLGAGSAAEPRVWVGAARVEITPELPIPLAGYMSAERRAGAERIERRLFARALAIGTDEQKPVVLITAELIGVTDELTRAVADSLRASHRVERERVALCATHTHTGPMVRGVLPFMFGQDLPADDLARIDRYTDVLREKLIRVAVTALADRKPCTLAWAEGKAGFATQRRKVTDGKYAGFGVIPDGMADHALPVLRIADERGDVRAVFTSYACHCTTLRGSDNFVHPDWAGEAAAHIERNHAGAIALVAIGCGADANPDPRTGLADAVRHGAVIAAEVERVLGGALRPLGTVTAARQRTIELPLERAVTREELSERLKNDNALVRYTASKFIQQLDRDRGLPANVPYPVQTWCFGSDLAMVFLGGEVVSEYSLRLRREFDATRLWVNAYANSVPCYIASRRMFEEGGYEVDASMNFYGWPIRLSAKTEELIIETVHQLVPTELKTLR